MGTDQAVVAGAKFLFDRSVENEVSVSPAQIQYLLKDKGAKINQLQAETGIGAIDLDRDDSIATIIGSEYAIESALRWLSKHSRETSVPLNSTQIEWFSGGSENRNRGGKGGSRDQRSSEIRLLMEASKVSFAYLDKESETMKLVGDKSAVTAAKAYLDSKKKMRKESIPIDKSQLGWVIGKNGGHIKELQEECGVDSVQVLDGPDRVELRGTSESVDLATCWLECHLGYLKEQKETEKEILHALKELQAMPVIRGHPVRGQRRPPSPQRPRLQKPNVQ